MQSISPVFTEDELKFEIEIAKEHAQYIAVIGLPISMQLIDKETGNSTIVSPWATAVRFQLNDEERAAIAAGKDLVLTQLNFGNPITPMNIQFCAAGEKPFFGEIPDATGISLLPPVSK